MNLLLRAASIYTPTVIKRKKLLELFACTAAAFGCEMPPVRRLPYGELLRSYARFTAEQANQALRRNSAVITSDFREAISPILSQHENASFQDAARSSRTPPLAALEPHARAGVMPDAPERDLPEIRRRLYDGAYRMGSDLRSAFHITNTAGALSAARVLYRALGIDLQASPAGDVTVLRCFFGDYYSSPVCELIASLDEGLFAGLAGGGRLLFTQRITDGCQCCKAEFRISNLGDPATPARLAL
jgi:hypothetical protein